VENDNLISKKINDHDCYWKISLFYNFMINKQWCFTTCYGYEILKPSKFEKQGMKGNYLKM